MPDAVACLCSSIPSRWGLLQRAILDYAAQTYEAKELVVVVPTPQYAQTVSSWTYANLGQRADVRVVARSVRHQYESLLHAMAVAYAPYLALWDDDNLNHPDRLKNQMAVQVKYPEAMTALEDSLYYFHDTDEVYVLNYQNPAGKPSERCAVTTLMGARGLWPEPKPIYRPSAAAPMVNDLAAHGVKAALIAGLPFHHMVGVRGDNLRKAEEHRRLAARSPGTRTAAWLNQNADVVRGGLEHYKFDLGRKPVVHGSDGIAFTFDPCNHWPADLYKVGDPDDGVERVTESTAT